MRKCRLYENCYKCLMLITCLCIVLIVVYNVQTCLMAQTESTFSPAVKERRWGSVLSSYSLISYITMIQMLCVTPTWLHLFALPPSPLVLSIRIKITFNYPVAYMTACRFSREGVGGAVIWNARYTCLLVFVLILSVFSRKLMT